MPHGVYIECSSRLCTEAYVAFFINLNKKGLTMDYKAKIKEVLGNEFKYLDEAIGQSFLNKAWIIEKLGLNKGNDYRLSFVLPSNEDNRPLAVALLKDIEQLTKGMYKFLDLSFMWQGKNKIRVSKALSVAYDIYVGMPSNEKNVFTGMLQVMRVAYSNFFSLCEEARRDRKSEILHKINVWYGDYIKNGRVGHISANPYDYFTLSDDSDRYCSYTSCVRPNGEYSNTLIHYLCGNNMLPFFITEVDKEKKIGRCCIYLSNDIVATGRYFGSMFDSDALLARDKVQEAFGGTWAVKGSIDNKYICNDSTGYVDFGYGVVTVRKDADFEKIYVENGICLACGGELDSSKDLICNVCLKDDDGYINCSDCGRRIMYEESYRVGDYDVCDRCIANYSMCDRCDEYVTETYEVEGEYLCEDCYNRAGVVVCDKCGTDIYRDNAYHIGDNEYYCEYCIDDIDYIECADCGKLVTSYTYIVDDDKNVCDRCLTEYWKCEGCGEYFRLMEGGFCEECKEERREENNVEEIAING